MADYGKCELKKVVAKLANSNEINPDLLKKLKTLCKRKESNVEATWKLVLQYLHQEHSGVRLNCAQIANELFTRSHQFRTLLLKDFETFSSLTIGYSGNYLPPPEKFKKKLRLESIRMIKEWFKKYGAAYRELTLLYDGLKEFVDFDNLCLVNDLERSRQREREQRLETLWQVRIGQIKLETKSFERDVLRWTESAGNLLSQASENQDPYKEELQGHFNELTKRLLPQIHSWVDTLTKAGRRTEPDMMRKCVELKTCLIREKARFDQYSFLNRDLANSKSNLKKINSHLSEDSTSVPAANKKKTDQEQVNNSDLSDTTISSHASSSKSSVPCVKLENLIEPDRMIVDPDKSRFWVSDRREGQELSVGATQKISEFVGECLPVKWSCRVKMASGALCPRMDRLKCPLHGLIVARNENGEPDIFHPSQSVSSSTHRQHSLYSKKQRKSATSRLKAASKYDENSRSRISKKIFNKNTLKRVSKDQKIYDRIRTKDKFVDQFNYS